MDASNIPEAVSLVGTLVDRVVSERWNSNLFRFYNKLAKDLGMSTDELELKLKASVELIEQQLEQ